VTTAPEVTLLVLRLSDSFSDFWSALARDVGAALTEWTPAAGELPVTDPAVVLIAAGGHETQIAALLTQLPPPLARSVPVIAVGAATSHRLAAQVVRAGAADYFSLPDDRDGLRDAVAAAVQRRRAALGRAALGHFEAQAHAFRDIVGESPVLKAALERAARVVPHRDATILVTGETGTGKELLARALHYGGPRAAAPFVELNCAALPAQLLESELFGHERGAFTDAKTAKPGLFEVAQGGTMFLDEVQHLAPELQGKLLRALDQKSVRRLGATASRTFDVRIVAATNVDLTEATLDLPPLRERGDDVILLARFFLRKFSAQYQLPEPALAPDVQRALLTHPWPGNVRELRNTIERGVLLSGPGTFTTPELGPRRPAAAARGPLPFPATLAEIQRAAAHAMLDAAKGNRSEAARRLGISRSRLQRLLEGKAGADDTDGDAI
jgi:DNA-binding NtrC family response regulator